MTDDYVNQDAPICPICGKPLWNDYKNTDATVCSCRKETPANEPFYRKAEDKLGVKCPNGCLRKTINNIEVQNHKIKNARWPSHFIRKDGEEMIAFYVPIYYKKKKDDGTLTKKDYETFVLLEYCPICGEKLIDDKG